MNSDEAEALGYLERLPEWNGDAGRRLRLLVDLLTAENSRQNLVSANSLAEVWRRHILDSAQLLRPVPRETSPWLDLGTGAGFPGLVVAVLRPDSRVVLVEARRRRVEWLLAAVQHLGLPQTEVFGGKVAELPTETFSAISARAFAPLGRLLELSARFSTSDTIWLLPKGRSAQQELDALQGWNHMFHVEPSLTDKAAGVIVGKLQGRKGKRS